MDAMNKHEGLGYLREQRGKSWEGGEWDRQVNEERKQWQRKGSTTALFHSSSSPSASLPSSSTSTSLLTTLVEQAISEIKGQMGTVLKRGEGENWEGGVSEGDRNYG